MNKQELTERIRSMVAAVDAGQTYTDPESDHKDYVRVGPCVDTIHEGDSIDTWDTAVGVAYDGEKYHAAVEPVEECPEWKYIDGFADADAALDAALQRVEADKGVDAPRSRVASVKDLEVYDAAYHGHDFRCGGCGTGWQNQYAIDWDREVIFIGWLDLQPCCEQFRVQSMSTSCKTYGFEQIDEIDEIERALYDDDLGKIRAIRAKETGSWLRANVTVFWHDLGRDYWDHPADKCTEVWSENGAEALAKEFKERVVSEYPEIVVGADVVWDPAKFEVSVEVESIDEDDDLDDAVRSVQTTADGIAEWANGGDALADVAGEFDSSTRDEACVLIADSEQTEEVHA